ncbi:MAG: hypothetical protein F6J90_42220 [Moorea sp. SIOASIH]|nr:hypothetical protein [Moorena sp. SIOASIH]NEO42584.1 hypothetical protein [Moorena sp. SIOASIH]
MKLFVVKKALLPTSLIPTPCSLLPTSLLPTPYSLKNSSVSTSTNL